MAHGDAQNMFGDEACIVVETTYPDGKIRMHLDGHMWTSDHQVSSVFANQRAALFYMLVETKDDPNRFIAKHDRASAEDMLAKYEEFDAHPELLHILSDEERGRLYQQWDEEIDAGQLSKGLNETLFNDHVSQFYVPRGAYQFAGGE